MLVLVFRNCGAAACESGNTFTDCGVSSDGQRFVMFPASDAESTNRGIITLVTPWFDELTRTFATAR